MTGLTDNQIERYNRNIMLTELGLEGQNLIRQGRVLIIGAGGLGSAAALYLAAAGIGTLGLVDSDRVELSNLQRQILHDTPSLGEEKTRVAARRIRALNPDVAVKTWQERLSVDNALDLIEEFDFIVDCTDNFGAKFLINDAAVLAQKPFSHAGALGFRGQTFTMVPEERTPCLRCILPEQPAGDEAPTSAQAGVLGAVAGALGTIQAAEAIKVITGVGEPLLGRLLTYDALSMQFRTVELKRDPCCPVCSDHPKIKVLKAGLYA
ncbi:MAG TPA: molybdopterin-synthase adenylyltransferase MoeB [archaeon]|nr:molybdopterin-synthase adenylyltransferase MoeB [archaeon]